MKKPYAIATTCILTSIAICGCSNSNKNEKNDSGNTVTGQRTTEQAEDTDTNFTSPDLGLFNLHGHVVTCVTAKYTAHKTGESIMASSNMPFAMDSVIFDTTGKLIEIHTASLQNGVMEADFSMKLPYGQESSEGLAYGSRAVFKFQRDTEGRFKSWEISDKDGHGNTTISFGWKDGKLSTYEEDAGEWSSHKTFFHDGANVAKTEEPYSDIEGIVSQTSVYYYSDIDDAGNWTGRSIKITRKTSDYDEMPDGEEMAIGDESEIYVVETRSIRYR